MSKNKIWLMFAEKRNSMQTDIGNTGYIVTGCKGRFAVNLPQ